jgi:hypothetical protein
MDEQCVFYDVGTEFLYIYIYIYTIQINFRPQNVKANAIIRNNSIYTGTAFSGIRIGQNSSNNSVLLE